MTESSEIALDAAASAAEARGTPTLSIVMPVFNTGRLLLASVRSVVAQTLFDQEGDGYWELLIVDDASTDAETIAALAEALALSPAIRVIANTRGKGAAGTRNTGIFAARGDWIGFLDSDDLLYPDFHRKQRDAFVAHPAARWRAAHFDVGDSEAQTTPTPLRQRSPCLFRHIEADYLEGEVSVLHRPVDVLLRCGCMQVMTVQIRRELVREHRGFREDLTCAEDYDLWVRLASLEDLYIAPLDAGIYRSRGGSLTRSGRPMYYGEDRMLRSARADERFRASRNAIDERLWTVYATFCFHYRDVRRFGQAAVFACRLIALRPWSAGGWRQLAAVALRR